jgi:serine/threonine-protein kinase
MSDPASTPSGSRPSESVSADLSGKLIGSLHLMRRLGRGAMADVYLAEQSGLNRWVAVKILKPELASDPTYVKRFRREAQAAASLVHANIAQIHEVGQTDGLHYIVQEYVQGQNLRQWLARNGPPGLPMALAIMRQVASALGKAAQHGVVHRDIKPENVMITGSGEVKVADFGLARMVRDVNTTATNLTEVGITMGTPLYMSPEQVEGKPLDHRSDLYSFGVMTYHMLTGKPPFDGETALAVAVQHVKKQARPLEVERPDLPPALCRVVHQMLAKNPDQRYQSSQELLRELYRIRVECCPNAPSDDLGDWDVTGFEPLTDRRIQAKKQLAEAMHTADAASPTRFRVVLAVLAGAVFLAAGVTAWATMRPAPLLSAPGQAGSLTFPRQATVLRQYYYASQIGTEEAWRSVIQYFPDNHYYVLRAEQQLGRIYLRDRDLDNALKTFDDLAAVPSSDTEFRAFGLAGKCGVLSLKGDYAGSAKALDDLFPIIKDLKDRQMHDMLNKVVQENRKHLNPQASSQYNQWLEEQFPKN